jgi:hypothetical protein
METGERVTPSDLTAYRISHDFTGPCCLCAHDTAMPQYVESAIYMAFDGPFFGEYVASCATNKCSYLGERDLHHCKMPSNIKCVVPIERMYGRLGLMVKRYQLRGKSSIQFNLIHS